MRATSLSLLVGLITLSATGCTGWRIDKVTPQELLARHSPESMRLTLKDSSRIVIGTPRLRGDTLVGSRGVTQVRIPLDSVARTETPHAGATPWIVGISVVLALGAVIAYAIVASGID